MLISQHWAATLSPHRLAACTTELVKNPAAAATAPASALPAVRDPERTDRRATGPARRPGSSARRHQWPQASRPVIMWRFLLRTCSSMQHDIVGFDLEPCIIPSSSFDSHVAVEDAMHTCDVRAVEHCCACLQVEPGCARALCMPRLLTSMTCCWTFSCHRIGPVTTLPSNRWFDTQGPL